MTRFRIQAILPLLVAAACAAVPAAADSIVTTDAFLPVVHIVGANGIYHTDVSIFNPSDQTADVYIYFEAADTNNTNAPGIRFTNGLPGRDSVTLQDILYDRFGVASGYGIAEVYSANSVPLIVTSNTYNVAGAAPGTFGQFSPGQPERNAAGFGNTNDYNLYVTGLLHDQYHVTNLAVINPSKYQLSATVELVDNQGNIWGRVQQVAVPPFSMHQLSNIFGSIFAGLNPPYDAAWRLNIYVDTNTGATILGYATLQDKRSGDPYLITAAAQVQNVPLARPTPDGSIRRVAPLSVPAGLPASTTPIDTTPVTRGETGPR